MDNRLDIDKLLENIEQSNKQLLSTSDLGISELQGVPRLKDECKCLGDMFLVDLTRLTVFNRHNSDPLDDLPPLDILFGILISVERLEKCSPPEINLYIKSAVLCLVYMMRFIGGCEESDGELARYKQDFYERIHELPEGNPFRTIFVRAYNNDNTYGVEVERRVMEEAVDEFKKTMKPWERYSDEVCHYMDNNKSANITSSEGITALIGAINNAHKISQDPKAPKETKANLIWLLRLRIWLFMDFSEHYFANELFNRRSEIERSNVSRNYIIFYYVQNEAIGKLTGNEIKEFKECLHELYRQHGEEGMLVWNMQKEDCHWQETISEPLKKALKEDEAKRERLFTMGSTSTTP